MQPGKAFPEKFGPAVPVQSLARIEVALLYQNLIGADLWERLESGISPEESEKAGRFVFDEDRRACIAAHWLKRRLLSRADPDVDPLSWQFALGAHGKPHLAGRSDLHVNLSHCRGLVACALRRGGPVGIDVEFIGRPAPREIVAHYFSPTESAWWHAQPEAEKATAFFRIWTLKEAFIKATGRGLSQSLHAFSVSPPTLTMLPEGKWANDAPSWRLYQTVLESPHILAVAWRHRQGAQAIVEPIIFSPESLF